MSVFHADDLKLRELLVLVGYLSPLFFTRFESQLARALKERQCTLKGQAWYVNVRGSVHWKRVYRVGVQQGTIVI